MFSKFFYRIKTFEITFAQNQNEPLILKYKDEILNGSDPEVYENMIPVYYDENEIKLGRKPILI